MSGIAYAPTCWGASPFNESPSVRQDAARSPTLIPSPALACVLCDGTRTWWRLVVATSFVELVDLDVIAPVDTSLS